MAFSPWMSSGSTPSATCCIGPCSTSGPFIGSAGDRGGRGFRHSGGARFVGFDMPERSPTGCTTWLFSRLATSRALRSFGSGVTLSESGRSFPNSDSSHTGRSSSGMQSRPLRATQKLKRTLHLTNKACSRFRVKGGVGLPQKYPTPIIVARLID